MAAEAPEMPEEAHERAKAGQRQWMQDISLVLVTLALKGHATPDRQGLEDFKEALLRLAEFAGIALQEAPNIIAAKGYTDMGPPPGGLN